MVKVAKIRNFMLFINMTACMFILTVIDFTSYLICSYAEAAEFLSTVRRIPSDPSALFVQGSFICLLFIFTFSMRQLFFFDNKKVIYTTLLLDTVLNIILLYILNCNYNGYILWLLANILFYVDEKWKYLVLITGLFIYTFASCELLGSFNALYSVKSYIRYYPKHNQWFLLGVIEIFKASNFIGFLFFCIQVIREQKNTIDEKVRLYAELERANEKLKKYALIKEKMGQAKERNRIAMEIHDTIGHSLTGISVGVDTCLAIMDSNPQAAKKQLEVVSSVAKDGIADIRRSVRTLQVDEQHSKPFDSSIRDMLSKAGKSSGIDIVYHNEIPSMKFEKDEENTIYRVIQESVTNSIRYGSPKKIYVDMSVTDDTLQLIIQDNGTGCDDFERGFGITHMTERVEMLHGSIDFYSHDGFTVKALIPLRKESV